MFSILTLVKSFWLAVSFAVGLVIILVMYYQPKSDASCPGAGMIYYGRSKAAEVRQAQTERDELLRLRERERMQKTRP